MKQLRCLLAGTIVLTLLSPGPATAQVEGTEVLGEESLPAGRPKALDELLKELRLKGIDEDPDFGISLRDSLRHSMATIMRTAPPADSISDIGKLIAKASRYCAQGSGEACQERGLLEAAKTELSLAPSACNMAARLFFVASSASSTPDDATALAYDAACLGSFVPRVINGQIESLTAKPPIIANPVHENEILSAVAVIEDARNHFKCAGLFLPGGKLLTARHCFGSVIPDTIQVRSAQSGKRWHVVPPDALPANNGKVASDWIVLSLKGSGFPVPPKINLSRLGVSPLAFVVGPIHSAKAMSYSPQLNPDGDHLRHSLRYPKTGTCVAISILAGCLTLTCQSVQGFSGTPVFSARLSDGSYDVIGLISGGEGAGTGCAADPALRFHTFAVSADSIRL